MKLLCIIIWHWNENICVHYLPTTVAYIYAIFIQIKNIRRCWCYHHSLLLWFSKIRFVCLFFSHLKKLSFSFLSVCLCNVHYTDLFRVSLSQPVSMSIIINRIITLAIIRGKVNCTDWQFLMMYGHHASMFIVIISRERAVWMNGYFRHNI